MNANPIEPKPDVTLGATPEMAIFANELRHEAAALQGEWFWFLLLGIALAVLGTIAIGSSVVATFATVIFFGALLLTGGAVEVLGSFWARRWSGFFLHLLSGVLSIVVGLFFLRDPGGASLAMTLLLATFLMAGGLFKIIGALTHRFASWGWLLLSGAIDLALGLMIWSEWPFSGLWVIGLFVGINLVMRGWTWIALALAVRSLPKVPV